MTRPSPSPGGDNRPGSGAYRPGAGGDRPGGGGDRPGTGGGYRPGAGGDRPGGGGDRPGTGGGYRPGAGGDRPGQGNYRPGSGVNRPGAGGSGSGWPDYGGNRPGINRPGGGWGGGWFGGNRWGGLWGWHGLGWRGFNSPFLGNWFRGSWGWNRFGGWFGPAGVGFWGWGSPIRFFPTWGFGGLAGWGLGPWANGWLYSGFTNPYLVAPATDTPVVANWPPVFVPDYSRPLDLTNLAPAAESPEKDDSTFLAAREAAVAGDFTRALRLIDLALQPHPNEPVLHEFRALCLFALGRYDEAAAALYVVLTVGPGWDWATMLGLYPDVATYTSQIRALEAAISGNATSAPKRFVLAYHYLVQDHVEPARQQFEELLKLQPRDELAAQFAKALSSSSQATTVAPTDTAPASKTAEVLEASPPPAALLGTWKAKPMPELSIELTLRDDGQFTWAVNAKGRTDSFSGDARYLEGVLTLTQADASDLIGKITNLSDKQFGFELQGDRQAATLQFSR
jgi:tetratricopeptide (TPR) repeat protein